MAFRGISAPDLERELATSRPPLILDVRRREAFRKNPNGVPGAVPVLLDEHPLRLPDVDRSRRISVYCLCTGESSSARVAQWLGLEGYTDISSLAGGLPAWESAGYPMEPVDLAARRTLSWKAFDLDGSNAVIRNTGNNAFAPLLVGQDVLDPEALPLKREMTVLFVDMVDSTSLLWRHSTEDVLRLVQTFMAIVTDVAIHHCGDVHDFQGDGAFLYFTGVGEGIPATFRLRDALQAKRREMPELPRARFALDAGPLVIGLVGTAVRQSLSFIGPSVNIAARILKLAPPEAIIATSTVVDQAACTAPNLAEHFVAVEEPQHLRGVGGGPRDLFIASPPDAS